MDNNATAGKPTPNSVIVLIASQRERAKFGHFTRYQGIRALFLSSVKWQRDLEIEIDKTIKFVVISTGAPTGVEAAIQSKVLEFNSLAKRRKKRQIVTRDMSCETQQERYEVIELITDHLGITSKIVVPEEIIRINLQLPGEAFTTKDGSQGRLIKSTSKTNPLPVPA